MQRSLIATNNKKSFMGNDAQPKSLDHRRLIREQELEAVMPFFSEAKDILEIGAGAGWQAKALADRGFSVKAIDLAESNYNQVQVWPVESYDGEHIPLPDNSVDAIFSSNVLEHVPHIDNLQKEMQRVLRDSGISVHIMPTATWRFWTTLSLYPDRVKKLLLQALGRKSSGSELKNDDSWPSDQSKPRRSPLDRLLPVRHGVRGTVLSETYYFSRSFWKKVFLRNGWRMEAVKPNGLFYTGHRVMGANLSLSARRALSSVLGSSCMIYAARKSQ
jgi:ubiquinone/menaquinone biosynthesis C-methylase UbiE